MSRYILYLILFLITACTTTRKPPLEEGRDIKLETYKWELKQLYGKEIQVTEGGKVPSLAFTGSQNVMNGHGGCNSMNGMYTVHDDLIKLHVMSYTEMACLDTNRMNLEMRYFEMLGASEKYKLRNKTVDGQKKGWLQLYKGDELVAEFESAGSTN
jgi:heat shock protein HslJ